MTIKNHILSIIPTSTNNESLGKNSIAITLNNNVIITKETQRILMWALVERSTYFTKCNQVLPIIDGQDSIGVIQ